jgi:chloramphenicol 3-O phosphotransferase
VISTLNAPPSSSSDDSPGKDQPMVETSLSPGQIVILNGAPRSGKSSIVAAIQGTFEGIWTNLGVDVFNQYITPPRYRPGIGLRPGGERPDLEFLVPVLYAALYESIAAHSRLGLNVVVDVGHHDDYRRPQHILADCAQRLVGLPVLFVGVHCPIDVIMQRRNAGQPGRDDVYLTGTPSDPIPLPVRRWQCVVHQPGLYDLEVDTSKLTPAECAAAIRDHLRDGPASTAFARLARDSKARTAQLDVPPDT